MRAQPFVDGLGEYLYPQLEVQPQTPEVQVCRTYKTIRFINTQKLGVRKWSRLIIDPDTPPAQFNQGIPVRPVHIGKVVFADKTTHTLTPRVDADMSLEISSRLGRKRGVTINMESAAILTTAARVSSRTSMCWPGPSAINRQPTSGYRKNKRLFS